MSLINISGLTFCHDGSYDNIFENTSLQLDTDWRLGLVGRNGRGKTTLLRLLMGELEYSGSITYSVDFEYFPYFIDDKSQNTEEILQKIAHGCEQWELMCELSMLDVSEEVLYRPFSTLSGGEQTKCLLCAMFLRQNSFLLIDEPTNHLDMDGRDALAKYLRTKKGFILVSHDRTFLDSCIDHIMSINRTEIEVAKSDFSTWLENRERRDGFELAENDKLKKEVKRLDLAAKKRAQWSDTAESAKIGTRVSGLRPDRGYIGHKAAKVMKRAKSIESRMQEAAEEKSKLLKNIETADSLKLQALPCPRGSLISLDKVSIDMNDRTLFEPVSMTLCEGDRVRITGKNGSGKTSLLRMLMGENIVHGGELYIKSGLEVSYIGQHSDHLSGSLYDYSEKHELDTSLFLAILRKLDFARVQFEKDMGDFSAGQKKKVQLAHCLCKPAHIYIWDEPLNYIDIFSRMQIEQLILECSPTMIFVEHDRAFSDKVAKTVLNLR